MPFDAAEVARQIEQSRSGARAEQDARAQALELALRIYNAVDEVAWESRVQDTAARRWVGVPLTLLHQFPHHGPAEPDYCVVATDSSFVAPDKHRGALCHLVNVGRVMIHYGDSPAAELDNIPNHYPEPPAGTEDEIGGRVLAAKCALRELEELYELARRYHASVALVDGSLMQLVNLLAKDEPVREIMSQYLRILEAFERIRVPVAGYISKPASGMVMRAIRLLACEQEVPHEQRPTTECTCSPLWSIDDSDLFWALLGEGELSPVFKATYRDLVGENAKIAEGVVFAYLGTQYEVSRLEFPMWAMDGGHMERAVQAVLHQCKLGQGYPNSLLLAHQYAVLHNSDRESYYFLLERAGLLRSTTEKARGKRMIGQSI
jgi:hypothetical protein